MSGYEGTPIERDVFMVAWHGGYEAPSYVAHYTEDAAWQQADEWWADADEESDQIDVLKVSPHPQGLTVTRLERRR